MGDAIVARRFQPRSEFHGTQSLYAIVARGYPPRPERVAKSSSASRRIASGRSRMSFGESGDGLAQTVSVGGVDIATYVNGEQGRPWIVVSNSLAANSSSWDHQLSLLTKTFRVLRYDTRGHGRSSALEGPYTFAHLTGDVLALMDHYEIEKANFLGLSMGGMTGLGLAIDHPSRVTRLICCDARSDALPRSSTIGRLASPPLRAPAT